MSEAIDLYSIPRTAPRAVAEKGRIDIQGWASGSARTGRWITST
ncbi:hypothetical protein HAT91_03969 [Dickeya solani]|nr:hypothetical protein HAT91_03969 [Dickeya solani]